MCPIDLLFPSPVTPLRLVGGFPAPVSGPKEERGPDSRRVFVEVPTPSPMASRIDV